MVGSSVVIRDLSLCHLFSSLCGAPDLQPRVYSGSKLAAEAPANLSAVEKKRKVERQKKRFPCSAVGHLEKKFPEDWPISFDTHLNGDNYLQEERGSISLSQVHDIPDNIGIRY